MTRPGMTLLVLSLAGTLVLINCLHREPGVPAHVSGNTPNLIHGVVNDEEGPVVGAVVRIQATSHYAITSTDGIFTLPVGGLGEGPFRLTAWAVGYYINGPVEAKPGQKGVTIQLHAHHANDNPGYEWLPSSRTGGEGENQGCAQCHSAQGSDLSYTLPVDEWLQDAHSQSAVNPRFLTMYTGTDMRGNRSLPTVRVRVKDYGDFPIRPDVSVPYYGPGYKLDFPDTAGNCAACHVPLIAVNDPHGADPTAAAGVALEGVNCDFCHKVWNIRLDPVSGLPYDNRPGVLSYEFRRPEGKHQFFAGPLDDVAPGEDTYIPLQRNSRFCAGCHFGVFWNTVVYNSFGEWLDSPYSDPQSGKTCQDCHMPPTGAGHFALPEKGGLERDPATIFSHRMPGALDEKLLQNAVTMKTGAQIADSQVKISVSITNDLTGHHVPTDSPLRHLILLVQAADADGNALRQVGGPTLPEWCGIGNPARGYYAGLPGKAYAKVLMEEWTFVSPTGAYWNPTRLISDNRIAAFQTDAGEYLFAAPNEGRVTVKVTLLFRRAFKRLMDQKGWDTPDIVMEQEEIVLNR
jgi:hypothetical protein